jgi:hypothetical protein
MRNPSEEISELRVAQGNTHTLVEVLSNKIDQFIKEDINRQKDLVQFRIESSNNLIKAATIIKDIKKEVDTAVNTSIPALQEKNASTEATLKIHTWLLRALIGITVIAAFGGIISGLTNCNSYFSSPEAAKIELPE